MSEPSYGSLEEVQEAFARWRAGGRSWRTPTSLRLQAVALLERYRIREVTQALGVDYKRLNRWRRELSNPNQPMACEPFVDLPAVEPEPSATIQASASTMLTLTRQARDGSTLSIQGELSPGQWRWALELLKEAGR